MSKYTRPKHTGATVFFTAGLRHRGSDLLAREINLLRVCVARTLRERPVKVHAWVVLPDHMHCIWSLPEGDRDYSTRWRIIKARFSRALPKGPLRASDQKRGERGIWQRRFWEHHIRNDADFNMHLNYCYQAPVRCGLVCDPLDWEYSSFTKALRRSAA